MALPGIIILLGLAALPDCLGIRQGARERSAIDACREVYFAQEKHRYVNLGYGFLEDLAREGLIDVELADGIRKGYNFHVEATWDNWSMTAVPVEPTDSTNRTFYLDERGIVRYKRIGRGYADSYSPRLMILE
jgi:hypothetical protein